MLSTVTDTGSVPASREGSSSSSSSPAAPAAPSPRQIFHDRIDALLSAPLPRCLQSTSEHDRANGARHAGAALQTSTHSTHRSASTAVPVATNRSRGDAAVEPSAAPPLPIYEQLLQKGRMQQEHREQLRQAAVEREMRELRPAPRLAPAAAAAPPPPEGQRIEDKLLRRAQERAAQAARAAQERQQREAEDLAAVAPFHPHISAHAQATKARYREPQQDRAAWRAARLKEMALTRHVADMEEMREVQAGPVINRRSARLAEERRAREGLAGLPASEALLLTEHRRRLAQWQAAEAEREARSSASPAITHRAAAMHRGGEVGSRLHAGSHDAAVRRLQREVAWREAHTPFQPEVTTLAAVTAPRYQREKSDSTACRASSALRSRSSAAASRASSAVRGPSVVPAFQPTIDRVSAAIADRLPETAMERLCRPAAVHSLSSYADPARSLDESAEAATPRGSAPAAAAVAAPPLSRAVVASLDAYERRRQARLEALQRDQRAEELRECSFQPSVNSRSAAMVAAAVAVEEAGGAAAQRGPRGVAVRSGEWQQQRERHVETMRRWQAELGEARLRDEQQSNHQQAHHSHPAAAAASPSVYGGDGRAWGVDAYLARQQLARQQRQERQHGETLRDCGAGSAERPAASTHSGAASAATPVYPSCAYDSGGPLRSLRPPVSASEAPVAAQLWASGGE